MTTQQVKHKHRVSYPKSLHHFFLPFLNLDINQFVDNIFIPPPRYIHNLYVPETENLYEEYHKPAIDRGSRALVGITFYGGGGGGGGYWNNDKFMNGIMMIPQSTSITFQSKKASVFQTMIGSIFTATVEEILT